MSVLSDEFEQGVAEAPHRFRPRAAAASPCLPWVRRAAGAERSAARRYPATDPQTAGPGPATAGWLAEAEFILSALEAGRGAPRGVERRERGRVPCRAPAELRLFSDEPGSEPWMIYARDLAPRSLGFITRHRLPLGYGGVVRLKTPRGEAAIDCVVQRCRETVEGWFEGSVHFNREQFGLMDA